MPSLKLFLATLAVCICAASTQAEPLTLTIVNPAQSGTPGSTLVFSGVLSNDGSSAALINFARVSFRAQLPASTPSLISSVGTGFAPGFIELLPITLQPFQSTGLIPLAIVTINPSFDGPFPATLNGVFSFIFRTSPAEGQIETELARQSFSVLVLSPQTTPVPEPVTMTLFITGLAGVGAAVSRKRKAQAGGDT